ncbi:MAG: dihydrofolate reductase [Turicibacter sp.]
MISMIVAFDENQLIGADNKLPWHFKEDLRYFKETTLGHDILMGRNTFDSILGYNNKPLPGRHNIILTHSNQYTDYDVTVIDELQSYIECYPAEKELFVIGGRSVYEQVLPLADRLYITHIKGSYKGDTYFPAYDPMNWNCISKKETDCLIFAVYERGNHKC